MTTRKTSKKRTIAEKDGMRAVIDRDPNSKLIKAAKEMLRHLVGRYNPRTGFYDVEGKEWKHCFFPSDDYFRHWLGLGEAQVERGRTAIKHSGWLVVDADGRVDLNWDRAASVHATIEETWEERKALIKRKRLMPDDIKRFEAMIDAAYAMWRLDEPVEEQEPGPREEVECPHCRKTGATNVMRRWHFDRCKAKPMSTPKVAERVAAKDAPVTLEGVSSASIKTQDEPVSENVIMFEQLWAEKEEKRRRPVKNEPAPEPFPLAGSASCHRELEEMLNAPVRVLKEEERLPEVHGGGRTNDAIRRLH
jgi:hypothetical protein